MCLAEGMSKAVKKKKKAVEAAPVSVRPLRDLTKGRLVLDGLGGALGIEDIRLRETVDTARGDLVAFKVRRLWSPFAGDRRAAVMSLGAGAGRGARWDP